MYEVKNDGRTSYLNISTVAFDGKDCYVCRGRRVSNLFLHVTWLVEIADLETFETL